MPFAATQMDFEIIVLSEASKDKYHMILLTCVIRKKLIQLNLYTKQKQSHRHRKQTYSYQKGMGEG